MHMKVLLRSPTIVRREGELAELLRKPRVNWHLETVRELTALCCLLGSPVSSLSSSQIAVGATNRESIFDMSKYLLPPRRAGFRGRAIIRGYALAHQSCLPAPTASEPGLQTRAQDCQQPAGRSRSVVHPNSTAAMLGDPGQVADPL